jgi:isoleucyl-tRNA synthetase
MTSIAVNDAAPYKTVITHGFVVDKDTQKKISKSAQGSYQKPTDAEFFVGKYGADVVRLWAASVQFTEDVPFSEENFTRISEAYRSFRNVLRILLGNLDGYHGSGDFSGATTVDRWLLSRLQEVIATCRAAYEEYDFRKVFGTLNQFVAVEVSALYVDITKDRLYCDARTSPRRQATQAVVHRLCDALTRLLAPILAYTADEAWESFGTGNSVHLCTFPEPDAALRDPALEARVEEWLRLRGVVAQAVEPARQAKVIGNALEAAVTLRLPAAQLVLLDGFHEELEEFFILSDLTLLEGAEQAADLARTAHPKCPRCWRHRVTVGANPDHPELCARCAEVCSAL